MKNRNIIKSKKCQQLNQREINLINGGAVEGILQIDVKDKNTSVVLTYTTEGLVGLQEFLQMNEMSKRLFVVLLRNVVVALKSVESNKLSRNLIMWDLNTSYVDPASWHVYLTYVPLQPFEITGNLKSFVLDTIAHCNFVYGEDIKFVQILAQDLNSVTAYTVGMLESYCDRMSEELLRGKGKNNREKACPACGSKLTATEKECPFCGKRILSRAVNTAKREEPMNDPEFWPMSDQHESGTEKVDVSRKPICVNKDENGVVTVFRDTQRIVQSVWLEDCSQAGKVFITKFPFRIGKMEDVADYRIYNNAVSRKHADILKEQGRYYVLDLGSTNGTYLNGKRIQPGVKEQLTDGMLVEFANSRYKIHID